MNDTELGRRLEKLERSNRRLKHFGLAALVVVAGLVAVAATRPAPQKITAHEFDVVDGAGNVRIRLTTFAEGASITVAPNLEPPQDGKENTPVVSIGTNGKRSWVDLGYLGWFKAPTTQPVVAVDSFMGLGVSQSKNSYIGLRDGQGYSMSLGSASTVVPTTGQTQQTSAASIVMFGNDKKHHVIWKAP